MWLVDRKSRDHEQEQQLARVQHELRFDEEREKGGGKKEASGSSHAGKGVQSITEDLPFDLRRRGEGGKGTSGGTGK